MAIRIFRDVSLTEEISNASPDIIEACGRYGKENSSILFLYNDSVDTYDTLTLSVMNPYEGISILFDDNETFIRLGIQPKEIIPVVRTVKIPPGVDSMSAKNLAYKIQTYNRD